MNEHLESFLRRAAKYAAPPRKRTIFSLGGRGYYENPTSDLLAFFLQPNAEHEFGTLFLSALFECLGDSTIRPELTGATVEREITTQLGNRMDLSIIGGDWCLILENKIWHIKNNPFGDYEDYAMTLGKKTKWFAVLSPDGESVRTKNQLWTGIKYADYCARLRRQLGKALFDAPHSKWHLFAREFILHIENELNNPTMNTEKADFVEQHEEQIAAVKSLDLEYRVFLQKVLKQTLEEKLPGHVFSIKDEKWPCRCYSDKWGQPNLAFWRKDGKFMLTVYLVSLSADQLSKAHDRFTGMKFVPDGKTWVYWVTQHGFDSRQKAIEELIRLAGIVAELLQVPPEPALTAPV